MAWQLSLPPDQVPLDASVRDLPGVDSIGILRAVTRIEAHFGLELEDEVVFRVTTIRELADLVDRKRATVPQAPRASVTIGPWTRHA